MRQDIRIADLDEFQGYPVSTPSTKEPTYKRDLWAQFSYQGYVLPATADPKDRCGDFFTLACLNDSAHPNGKYYFDHRMNLCKRGICSHLPCMRKWRDREANRIKQRLILYIRKKHMRPRVIHLIGSVPVWDYGLPVEEMKKHLYQKMKDVGVVGGCTVFHPARFETDGTIKEAPHFHVLGFGWVTNIGREYKKDGWIVKNLGVRSEIKHKVVNGRSKRYVDAGESFATAQYELGHCGLKPRRTSVTWFGTLSYNKKLGKVKPEKTERCPVCRCVLEVVQLSIEINTGLDPPDLDKEFKGWYDRDMFVISDTSPYTKKRRWNKEDGREGIGTYSQPYVEKETEEVVVQRNKRLD